MSHRDLAKKREPLKRLLLWADALVFLAVFAAALLLQPHTIAWLIGALLAGVAFPLWVVARLQLASSFSFKPEAKGLVTHGLYSKIRHPI